MSEPCISTFCPTIVVEVPAMMLDFCSSLHFRTKNRNIDRFENCKLAALVAIKYSYSWGRGANIQALRGLPKPRAPIGLSNSHLPDPTTATTGIIFPILVVLIDTIRMPPQATSLRFALSATQFWAYCKCPSIARSDLMPLDPMSDKCP